MLGGMVTCLIWSRLGSPYFVGLDPAEAGVLVSAALMFAVSLGTSPASDATLRQFFEHPGNPSELAPHAGSGAA
jgi:hypothetical protein